MEEGEGWHNADDAMDDQAERRVLFAALDSFLQYRRTANLNVTHRRRINFYALPMEHQSLLREPPFDLLTKFDLVDDAIDANAEIASRIYQSGFAAFGVGSSTDSAKAACDGFATQNDVDKARSTIRQFYREWSTEGAAERESCYGAVLDDLRRLFGTGSNIQNVKVLIPGAGLGRLVFEICRLGFNVEGNEISFHQLLASNWILNQVQRDEKFDLFPSAFAFSNQIKREYQLKKVQIPDVHPGSELEFSSRGKTYHAFERMAMTAADFVVLYSHENQQKKFDVVTTVFFIDTAPNVIRYIETIHSTLKDGGTWINIGPLLWHFEERGPIQRDTDSDQTSSSTDINEKAGIEEPGSFELTNEELLLLVERLGFVIEDREIREDMKGYIQDSESMVQNAYRTSHFVARKKSS